MGFPGISLLLNIGLLGEVSGQREDSTFELHNCLLALTQALLKIDGLRIVLRTHLLSEGGLIPLHPCNLVDVLLLALGLLLLIGFEFVIEFLDLFA